MSSHCKHKLGALRFDLTPAYALVGNGSIGARSIHRTTNTGITLLQDTARDFMIDISTAVRDLAQASKELEPLHSKMVSHWGPDKVPSVLLMAEFARRFATSFDLIPKGERAVILALLERFLKEGDHVLKESVRTGFFESLLNESDRGNFDFSKIKTMLGPESRAYCRAWNQFCGVEMDLGDDEVDNA